MFRHIRSSTTVGTRSFSARKSRLTEPTPVMVSPTPGRKNPRIGSSPMPNFVPGMRMRSSSQRTNRSAHGATASVAAARIAGETRSPATRSIAAPAARLPRPEVCSVFAGVMFVGVMFAGAVLLIVLSPRQPVADERPDRPRRFLPDHQIDVAEREGPVGLVMRAAALVCRADRRRRRQPVLRTRHYEQGAVEYFEGGE